LHGPHRRQKSTITGTSCEASIIGHEAARVAVLDQLAGRRGGRAAPARVSCCCAPPFGWAGLGPLPIIMSATNRFRSWNSGINA
jgi:hypothetical protein